MARVEVYEIVVDGSGRPVGGASVQVNLARTATPATVFAAETGGTTLANPLTTVNGAIPGWLEEGEYDLEVSGPGITATERRFNAIVGGMPKLATSQVTAAELATDSVSTAEIAAGAVGNAELANDSVTATKIAADAVGVSEIAAGAVGTAELANDAVNATKIAADAVGSSEIAAGAVGTAELATDSVTNAKIGDNAVGVNELAENQVVPNHLGDTLADFIGVSNNQAVRRGKSIITTQETTTSAAYTTLTTPDQVSNVVLPTDGLIVVGFSAYAKTDGAGAPGSAAIFLSTNQLKTPATTPLVQETTFSNIAAEWHTVASTDDGLGDLGTASTSAPSVVTTGMVFGGSTGGGGLCAIWAAAGTYDVSVRWKTSSGTLTAKERRLWVWTMGF